MSTQLERLERLLGKLGDASPVRQELESYLHQFRKIANLKIGDPVIFRTGEGDMKVEASAIVTQKLNTVSDAVFIRLDEIHH